jgi:predicted RNA-binding Zn ribbon-like protein
MERRMLTPYSEEVDGLVLPAPLSGHPALDFCNTFAGWNSDPPGDFLKTYAHLAVWSAAAGLVMPPVARRLRRVTGPAADAALERAREFRRGLYAACLDPRPGPAWDRVAAVVVAAAGSAELEVRGGRPAWVLDERLGVSLPLLAVARSAGELLTSDDLSAVHACPGRGCGWLFLDRRGKRRWCTMAMCGNRAKVRAFARRARARSVGAGIEGEGGEQRGVASLAPDHS